MLITIIAIAVLIVLSAFFSGSETALTATSPSLIHQMAQSGDRRAKIINRLQQKKERLIGAILLGNNLVNIYASALATSLMISVFGEMGVAYATITMTLLVLVFAEILPKTYAIQNSTRAAIAVARPINALVFLTTPITLTIGYLVRGILFVCGLHSINQGLVSDEELRGAIELRETDDEDGDKERAMLHSVLDLSDVQVGEIMVHRKIVESVNADLPVEQQITEILGSPFTRVPIWRGTQDNVVGVIHVKALLREVRNKQGNTNDIDIEAIAADPWFVPEQTPLLDQLQAFRDRREHFALIVDEYGSLMGVVTLEDILEEIVGDISDEHDVSVSGVVPQADGSYLIDGMVTLRDLNREFNWGLPDEEAATIAGLVLQETRRIPEIGQSFKFFGFRFDIIDRQNHQITSIRVTPS